MYTLDTTMKMNGVDRVDFVKMDVDGFEGKVIRGARETLTKHHPILFFEVTPSALRTNGEDPAELVSVLTGLGYSFRTEARKPISDVGSTSRRWLTGTASTCSRRRLIFN